MAGSVLFSPRRSLGSTGFAATALGIGDLADRSLPMEQCVATARRAIDVGLNVIDTAPGYESGFSEEIVGRAVRGRRDAMFVISKVDELDRAVAPQVDESLRRLGLDHVDLMVFHGLSSASAWARVRDERMGELAACAAAGKVRFRGISAHDPDVLREAIESDLCDVVMFAVGPFCHPRYVDEILPLAKARGVGTVCFKAFGAGKLLGDTEGYGRALQERPRGKFSSGGQTRESAPLLPHLTVEECLHFTLTLDPDVALLGLSFPNEQDAAFAAARTFRPLSPDQMADVRRRAAEAVVGKGRVWWDPAPSA